MKTFIRPLVTLLFTAIFLNLAAQTGNIVVFAPKGEKFTMFIGNTIQNNEPAARVEVDNPGGPAFKIKVVFPDASIHELSKQVFNKPQSTMFFKVEKNAKGTFALESTSSEWMDKSASTEPDKTPSSPPAASEQSKKDSKSPETAKKVDGKGCENPISDADFTGQLIDISARPFEPMQLSAAKKMAETHCLLVSQVKLVLNVFDSESSRLSFAKFAWDYTYDRENYAEVNDELHNKKSKDDLDLFIAGKSK